MCPYGYYANGIAGKYGTHHDELLGFHGLKLKCSTNMLSDSRYVEWGPEGYFLPINEGRNGNFISSYKIKFAWGERLWGLQVNYEGMPVISKIDITYNKVLEASAQPVVIDSQVINNCGSNTSTQSLTYSKTH
jgi:hypothetical protein